jgi:hypothetical protein
VQRDDIKPRGVRKATLTKKAIAELRLKIDCALRQDGRRLGRPAVDFLVSIRGMLAGSAVRLSKKQRDTTDAILAQAFSDAPVVILEGQEMADLARLISYAAGDGRVSSFEENVMVTLQRRLDEPAIAVSPKQWRIVEEIKQKTYFGKAVEPPPIDPDGLVENEDPDGMPPERDETEVDSASDWATVGVDDDEGC